MELKLLTNAIEFAAKKHASQRRKGANRIPYINHLLEVLNLLTHNTKRPNLILLIAGVLHDTLEDTDTSEKELEDLFGKKIVEIVLEVTDDMKLPSKQRKKLQIEKASNLSDEAKQIKIADKTCNIKDILYTRIQWDRKRKIDYIVWAEQVVRGCSGINPMLEQEFNDMLNEAKLVLSF